MFDIKRWRYALISLGCVFLLLLGSFGCGNGEEEAANDHVNGEDDDEQVDEENPYDDAEKIVPVSDRIIAMDEDFRSVLKEIFEEEPKLVSTSEFNPLVYVVDRVITPDDVSEIKELLGNNGYETAGTEAEENRYELDISISGEVMEEKYEGDVGGNMYVEIWTAEEGEKAQKIYVKTL